LQFSSFLLILQMEITSEGGGEEEVEGVNEL
jgi:hypothetical protein